MQMMTIAKYVALGGFLSACASIEGGERTGAERFVDAGQDLSLIHI